ncbi:NAD(P)-dependent oxidoreductase [Pseudooceanicola sp. LIPI14-2-Ac024]|uniref:NAD(P)-dependent oxidoreductase n=1 Tax=Pseudooceanicola sp. LIPI14-2-Ac024 TaxID=3344875 RepID=UPI0035CEDC0A
MTRLGFVGTGTMGDPMVACLVRGGHRPLLLDASAGAARRVADREGLEVAEGGAALGAACDTVILMLPTSAIVREVCLGPGGLAEGMDGGVIVDMSSSDPIETRTLGAELAERGITLLDAPVSGGVRKARDGTLAIMLGGDDAGAMDAVEPALRAMGKVFRAGPLAAGHATKALNNYVSAAGLLAACEAVIVGRDFGLDPAVLTEIVNASTGRNNSTENKMAQFILSGAYRDAGFAMSLMAKDVGLAAALGRHTGHDFPGLGAISEVWAEASDQLGTGADHTEIMRYLEGLEEG